MKTPVKNNFKYQKIKLDGWKNTIEGIFLEESKKWLLIQYIFADYMLDGYAIINKKHIQKISTERFVEKIMIPKMGDDYIIPFDLKITSGKQIVNSFANENLLFQIQDEDDSCSFIGKVSKSSYKSFTINLLTPKIKWDGDMAFDFDEVRAFNFMSDYLYTLDNNCKKKSPPR